MHHLEFLVEEPSMKAFLEGLLPRLAPGSTFQLHAFQSKGELRKKVGKRLLGYARQPPGDLAIFVLVDRDRDDCAELKTELEHAATSAGLGTRAAPRSGVVHVVSRIAVEELEAWYFGDWKAVRAVYPKVPASVPQRARFRDPDGIPDTWEALERVLQDAGYFAGGLPKVEVARQMGTALDAARNRSASFRAFREALVRLAA